MAASRGFEKLALANTLNCSRCSAYVSRTHIEPQISALEGARAWEHDHEHRRRQAFHLAYRICPLGTRWRGLARRIALLGIAAAAVAGCKGEAAIEEKEAVRPVKVAVVAAAPQGRTLTYSGVVRPRIESSIGFRVAGKIVERAVNVGDRVKVGQVIARLDETDLKLAESSAKAAVAGARTRRDVARDNLERAKPLLPSSSSRRRATTSDAMSSTRRPPRSRRRRRSCARPPTRSATLRSRPTRPASSRP